MKPDRILYAIFDITLDIKDGWVWQQISLVPTLGKREAGESLWVQGQPDLYSKQVPGYSGLYNETQS